MNDETDHLETEYVFLDTEAYVREKFNWRSKAFGRIEELSKSNQLRILTTSITKREVKKKILEALTHARSAFKKYDVIAHQLGISTENAEAVAPERLFALFDEFLKVVKATDVPLTNNLEKLFDDYFGRIPPFSEGKKAEFPDAAVVDALKTFATQRKKRIYVVSDDPDLKSCCMVGSGLIHAPSLNDIISRATVTKKLHDDLLGFASNNHQLTEDIRAQLKNAHIRFYGLSRFADHLEIEASVDDVDDFKITALNVISRASDGTLVCDIEFEASLYLSLLIAIGSYEDSDDDAAWVFSSAEATFQLALTASEKFLYLSVSAPDSVEIDANELHCLRRFR